MSGSGVTDINPYEMLTWSFKLWSVSAVVSLHSFGCAARANSNRFVVITRMVQSRIVWFLLALVSAQDGHADRAPARVAPPITETQLTLQVPPYRGQATVIAISGESLTVLTAAHFLGEDAVGKAIRIPRKEGTLAGRVAAVARNPKFHPIRSRNPQDASAYGTLGVDSAIVTMKLDLNGERDRRSFAKIRPADLTREPISSGAVVIVPVHIVDQTGKEHVVRAGNHLNPKCLAWGRRNYDVQRGDSGAGVFLARKTSDGDSQLVLIGNVSQTDDRGGIASLASRTDAWIDETLARLQSPGNEK
jgi:hypothetical protein